MFRGEYTLPTSFGGDSIREQYKLAKIQQEVADRDRLRKIDIAAITAETARTLSLTEQMGALLDERVAKTNAILVAEKERAKTARDQYYMDLEAARQARIAEAASTSRSVAESLASQLLQEQDQLQSDAEARAQRINDMMRNPGGAPTIMAGSAEDQLAKFNAANASMQSVSQQQLTIQQRIDKELTRIREKNEAVERLFQEVLNRFPVINPV
jgi:myosin heavy subunit